MFSETNILLPLIRLVIVLIAVFFIVRPELLPTKYKPRTIRVFLGLALALYLAGVLLQIVPTASSTTQSKSQSSENEPESKKQTQLEILESKVRAKLPQFSEKQKSGAWSVACQKFNSENLLALVPNSPVATAELMALHTCACLAQKLENTAEFKASEEILSSTQDFDKAMEIFDKLPRAEDISESCGNI